MTEGGCVTEPPRRGGLERVFVSPRGMHRARDQMQECLTLLDNPICSVINHTHYRRRDGSALIKASSSLLRAFIHTHTHTTYRQTYFYFKHISLEDTPRCERSLSAKWVGGVWKLPLIKTFRIAA